MCVAITDPDATSLRLLYDKLVAQIEDSLIELSRRSCNLKDLFPSSLFRPLSIDGVRPELPLGWEYPDREYAAWLLAELQIELPPGHRLFGCRVETVAACCDDDTLFRHLDEPDRFTVVHLTLRGGQEIDGHPTITFEGTFSDFLAREWQRRFDVSDLTLAGLEREIMGIDKPADSRQT